MGSTDREHWPHGQGLGGLVQNAANWRPAATSRAQHMAAASHLWGARHIDHDVLVINVEEAQIQLLLECRT
eukprot:scaffold255813_cov27-Tisochrysis_lutea.AAC.2